MTFYYKKIFGIKSFEMANTNSYFDHLKNENDQMGINVQNKQGIIIIKSNVICNN